MAKIRAVITEGDRQNGYKRVQVLFGTNYFLEIVENDGRVEFLLGAHHTGFSQQLTPEHMQLFADMANVEMVLIDQETRLADFKKELRWNETAYGH